MSSMTRKMFCSAVAATWLMIAGSAQAADRTNEARKKIEDASGVIKMNEVLCKDIMRFSGDDRLTALAVLHGYFLGKKGTTEYVVDRLARASDDFTEYCLDHPGTKALDAFAIFVK